MVDVVWSKMAALASLLTFVILLVVALLFMRYLFAPNRLNFVPDKALDGRLFRPDEIAPTLADFQKHGHLEGYLRQEWLDLLFALDYALLLAVVIAGLGSRTALPHWLVLLPFAAAFFDWVENALFIALMHGTRASHTVAHPVAIAACAASRLKWGLAMLAVSAAIITAVEWLRVVRR